MELTLKNVSIIIAVSATIFFLCRAAVKVWLSYDEPEVVSEPMFFPMHSCPRGKTVLLLNLGGVATFGSWDGRSDEWQGWYPVPVANRNGDNQ